MSLLLPSAAGGWWPRVALLCVLIALADEVSARPPRRARMCIFNDTALSAFARIGAHAMDVYGSTLFPDTKWELDVIPFTGPRNDGRPVVAAYVAHQGTECDFVSYALFTERNKMVASVVPDEQVWVSGTASSVWLSWHPTLARTIPTEADFTLNDAIAAFHFGWRSVNMLLLNDEIGSMGADSFASTFTKLGGSIDRRIAIQPSDRFSEDAYRKALAELRRVSPSRVLYLVGSHDIMLLRTLNIHESFVPLLGFQHCGEWAEMPGAVCTQLLQDVAKTESFMDSFAARNKTLEYERFGMVGSDHPLRPWNVSLAVDAMRLGMATIYGYNDADHIRYPTRPTYARSVSFDGLSGNVRLRPDGDRIARFGVFNMEPAQPGHPGSRTLKETNAGDGDDDGQRHPSSHLVRIGTVESATTIALENRTIYWPAGAGLGPAGYYTENPPNNFPSDTAESFSSTFPYWAIGLSGAVLVISITMVHVVLQWRALARRPTDTSAEFTALFIVVRNHADIRDLYGSDESSRAFTTISNKVKQLAATHGCHVARHVDDVTALVVAKQPKNCVAMSMELAEWAVNRRWERDLNPATAFSNLQSIVDRTTNCSLSQSLARSISGRRSPRRRRTLVGTQQPTPRHPLIVPHLVVGIHTDHGVIDRCGNPKGVFVYGGRAVDYAAAITDAAVDEQVVISATVAERTVDDDGKCTVARGKAEPFMDVPLRKAKGDTKKTVRVQSLIPEGYPAAGRVQSRVAKVLRRSKRRVDSGEEGLGSTGGVLDTMAQADNGLSRRRIAVVAAFLPSLIQDTSEVGRLSNVKQVVRTITEIKELAKRHKGKVASVSGGRVYLTVGVEGVAVSQPERRAASIACDLIAQASISPGFAHTTVGVAAGRSLEGVACSGVDVSCGLVWTWARIAQQIARLLGETHPLIAAAPTSGLYENIAARFDVETADLVALPACDEGIASSGGVKEGLARLIRLLGYRDEVEESATDAWLRTLRVGGGDAGNPDSTNVKLQRDAEARWAALTTARVNPERKEPRSPNTKQAEEVIAEEERAVDVRRLAEAEAEGAASYSVRRAKDLFVSA